MKTYVESPFLHQKYPLWLLGKFPTKINIDLTWGAFNRIANIIVSTLCETELSDSIHFAFSTFKSFTMMITSH